MDKQNKQNNLAIILTLSLGTLLGTMNLSIFNVAMPALMTYFNTDVATVQWLSSGYMLAAGVITPAAAFFGDRFGYKRTFNTVVSLALLLAVIGTFSWCIEALIVVRIFFGMTAGLLMPLTRAMLYQSVPVYQQAKATGIWGTANIVGGALPTCLTGIIISFASWRMLFVIMVPIAALLLFCGMHFLPADVDSKNTKLDTLGFALTAIGSFILLFAFSNLSKWGFTTKFFISTFIGFIFLAIYVKKSWNTDNAMLNLGVLKYPRYVAALLVDCMNIIALYMITFVMPLFLQNGLQLSALLTSAILLPGSFVIAAATPFATNVLTKKGEKTLALAGVLFIIIGSSIFLNLTIIPPIAIILLFMCIRSFGIGFMNLLTTNTSMAAVPMQLSGHASALTNWMRQMVGALITSIASNIISLRLISAQAETVEEISAVYVSSTSLLMTISCVTFLAIIPIALKYFRGKKDMENESA